MPNAHISQYLNKQRQLDKKNLLFNRIQREKLMQKMSQVY